MSSSSTSSPDIYKPVQQLVVYSNRNNAYIEHHDIIEDGNKRYLSEGKPLAKKTLRKLLESASVTRGGQMATMRELMPENVLFFDPRPASQKLIWFMPPMKRKLEGIYKKPSDLMVPATIYILNDDELSIFCTKSGKHRPTMDTLLFHCPLPNIYDDGNVCMGNVKTPRNYSEVSQLVRAWDFAFWGSKFDGYLNDGDKFEKIIKSCIKSKSPIPTKLLNPLKKKLKDLL